MSTLVLQNLLINSHNYIVLSKMTIAINGVFHKRIKDNIGPDKAATVITELLSMVDRLQNTDRFDFHWKNRGRHLNGKNVQLFQGSML